MKPEPSYTPIPTLEKEQVDDFFRDLREVKDVRNIDFNGTIEDGQHVVIWVAEVLVGDYWFGASLPDWYPEGAEIDWDDKVAMRSSGPYSHRD